MKQVKFNGNYLELYDSIDEMPITNYNTYNRYVMIDSGIGSDLQSIGNHIQSIRRYVAKGNKKDANQALNNLHQNMMFVVQGTSPQMNAFVAIIKTLNGSKVDHLDPEDVIKLLNKKGLTIGKVKGFLSSLKKKLMSKLNYSFLRWQTTPEQRSIIQY